MVPHIVLNFNFSPEAAKAFEGQMMSVASGQLPTPLSFLAGAASGAVSVSLPTPSAPAGGMSPPAQEDGLPTPLGPVAASTRVEEASALLPTPMNVPFAPSGASSEWMQTAMDYPMPSAASVEGAQGLPAPFDKPESAATEPPITRL